MTVIESLQPQELRTLGCCPRWKYFENVFFMRRMRRWWVKRRYHELDFALVTAADGSRRVIRVTKPHKGEYVFIRPIEGAAVDTYQKLLDLITARSHDLVKAVYPTGA